MNLFKHNRLYSIFFCSVLLILLVVSCSRSADPPAVIQKVTPAPSGTPKVEYGASLNEWEEATQGENEEVANVEEPEEIAANEVAEETAEGSTTNAAAARDEDALMSIGEPFERNSVTYREIMWDGLIPLDFTADSIMAKYQEQIDVLEDGSPEANELFGKMQEEFNNAPTNDLLNEVQVRIPGFIAPLEYVDGLITEFLLVPYFGACIHVPPPPANQTVMVTTAEGEGIAIVDSDDPIWVMGTIVTEATDTELAAAGYNIQNAIIEPYTPSE